jgi:hypothetical protein
VLASLVRRCLPAALLMLVAIPSAAAAAGLNDPVDQWLPSSDGATWTYQWSDSAYSPTPTKEQYTFATRTGTSFNLRWTTENLDNPDAAVDGQGVMQFNRSDAGLINSDWSSTPPPSQFPILCAQSSQCGNSLAGALYMLIWGTRGPVLPEPLLQGTSWGATGGANNDVSSQNRYLGTATVVVPAFPNGVSAAKIQSEITQAGALGDPYGSGIRTTWWVRGVGPVRIDFDHTGGEEGRTELLSTNLTPLPAPPDLAYLPLNKDDKAVYRWTNSKHMRKPATQKFTVADVVNNTARVDVASKGGPIKVAGAYVFAKRLSGITGLAASTKAATLAKFPPLGPRALPKSRRRHFFTPFDLMTYGFNPVLPAYPAVGDYWKSKPSGRDYEVFGVKGWSRVVGVKKIKTPAGKFDALEVHSQLRQPGFRFGSGERTSWFAPGKGLVKLVFKHRDGSVSRVTRLR